MSDQELKAEARFKVDRHQLGVSYRGSTIRDDLVDDDFWLELIIEARPRASAVSRQSVLREANPATASATRTAPVPHPPRTASP